MLHDSRDQIAIIALFAVGAILGGWFVVESRWLAFYQTYMTESVMWACGRGFHYLPDKPAALIDFLTGRAFQFDCANLGEARGEAPSVFVYTELYLEIIVSALWRVFGVSYRALIPLMALLHGAYVVGCFVFARLWCRRSVACGLAMILALSPSAIALMFLMRDYCKAPFFIWGLTLLMLSFRADRLNTAIKLSAAAGLVIGAGIGFRADLMLLLPVGTILLALGGDGALRPFRNRVLAVLIFVVLVLGSASPMLAFAGGGRFGSFVMQGATTPFVRLLEVRPGPYELGWAYSDELTLSGIAADLRPSDPNWDAQEPAPARGVSQSLQRSTSYLLQWAGYFAGDFATHALKAAGWIAGYPAFLAAERRTLDPGGAWLPDVWFGKLSVPLYLALAQPILPLFGAFGLLALLLHVFTRSPREALGLAVSLAMLMTYPAIQFSIRHVFHLEILFWLGMVFFIRLLFHWRELKQAGPRFAAWLAGGGVLIAAVYSALLFYQDHVLPQHVAELIATPRQPVQVSELAGANGTVLVTIPLPERYRDLVFGPSDAETPAVALIGNPWRVQAAADRLVLTIGGRECPPGVFSLGFVYKKSADAWQPFDHTMLVEAPTSSESRTQVIVPAFYRATQYLEALLLPADRSHCIDRVERIEKRGSLPVIFSAMLSPSWQSLGWHQGFGSFSLGQ